MNTETIKIKYGFINWPNKKGNVWFIKNTDSGMLPIKEFKTNNIEKVLNELNLNSIWEQIQGI